MLDIVIKIKWLVSLVSLGFLLTACVASPPPYMDAKFGEAFEMVKAQQTANPDASLNTTPVVGIDGQAGDAAFDSYRNSFITPPAATSRALNVGTSGGSTGAQ